MAGTASIRLPPFPGGGHLMLAFYAPLELISPRPTVAIFVNDVLIDQVTPTTDNFTGTWRVDSNLNGSNLLRIQTTQTVVPADVWPTSVDHRDLGLMLTDLAWVEADDRTQP
jgi:hypothetical protein